MTLPAKQGNSLKSKKVRTKTISPLLADDPPWQTLPDPTEVLELDQRVDGVAGENDVRAFIVFPIFRVAAGTEKAGPTVTYTVWIKDNSQKDGLGWIAADSQAGIVQRQGREAFQVQNCQIWVQVTAVGGVIVAGDTCEFRAAEVSGD